ncbi:hypothetical protein JDV02_005289 [Purpureocillium takamizusanense]|uniref:Uncharacterized protein n=1 Tax=Purpureocillium takamizusanense TaxID=2060973 RepID=A0A9Q8QI52_9HYPO|nr:uncharacterized protein JDV02_005289 [Purpureocillium takamizusanense]UNI19072.1 hypothetical protein JDV02_005289 [Purpureocillium takamizusanense]
MAPASSKANYKTYEAQARMVRAIVAAHPEVKWNYKDIAKYFGQSTADGMQFQFRGIKKDAETLRRTVAENGDAANCLNLSASGGATPSAATTPSKSSAVTTPTSSRRTGTGTARKRPLAVNLKKESSDDDDDGTTGAEDSNYSERDQTPSKRTKTTGATGTTTSMTIAGGATGQKNVTPRRAAQKANVTIASVAAQLQDSESPTPIERTYQHHIHQQQFAHAPAAVVSPSTERQSLFGPHGSGHNVIINNFSTPATSMGTRGGGAALPAAFARNGSDVCMTSMARPGGSFTHRGMAFINDDFDDGEY